jgi:hypothetical protein
MIPRFVSHCKSGSKREQKVCQFFIRTNQNHAPAVAKYDQTSPTASGADAPITKHRQRLLSTETTTGALGPPNWVEIVVLDRKSNRFMGNCEISFAALTQKNCVDVRVDLDNVPSGSVHVRISVDYKLVHLHKGFLRS